MKISKQHRKTKCPGCGSRGLITLGLDQLCDDCPWTNSLLLVQLGQLDSLEFARRDLLGAVSFDDLDTEETTPTPIEVSSQSTSLLEGAS